MGRPPNLEHYDPQNGIQVDYFPEPTIQRFMLSDARVRAVIGPVGCVSADTEVITPEGWVRIDQWNGQAILEWSPDGVSEFKKPEAYIVEPCRELISFTCGHVLSMSLSPEHRVPLYDWNGRFKVVTAERLARHPSRNIIPTGFTKQTDTMGMSDAAIRLWVAIAADGCYPKAGKQCMIVVRKERKKTRLRALLKENGIEFTERYSPNRPTEGRFAFARPDHPKHFDNRWWNASTRELGVLLEETEFWDGLYGYEEKRFSTTLKDQADIVQYAAHACGLKANIRDGHRSNENHKPCFNVSISRPGSAKGLTSVRIDGTTIKRVPTEDGKKYCFTTSTGFFVARHNGAVFCTGNSGKSSACVMELFRRACLQAPHRGVRHTKMAIIRQHYPELSTTTIPTATLWLAEKTYICPQTKKMYSFTINRSKPMIGTLIIDLQDGTRVHSEWIFLALDDDSDATKLKSLEISLGWINEASEITKLNFTTLLGRIGRFPAVKDGGCTFFGVICDSNPPQIDHWLPSIFEQEKPKDYEIFHQPPGVLELPRDNPSDPIKYIANEGQDPRYPAAENLKWLPGGPSYYLNQTFGASREYINVMLRGLYGQLMTGKPVYPEFLTEVHVAKEELKPYRGIPLTLSFDFGVTPSCIIGQLSPRGQLRGLDELVCGLSEKDLKNKPKDRYFSDMGVRNFARNHLKPYLLNGDYAGMEIVCTGDPMGSQRSQTDESTCMDELAKCGFNVIPASTNSFIRRREAVEGFMMRRDGLLISPRCLMLVKGFQGGYCYRMVAKPSGVAYTYEPSKNEFSHPHDAFQYFAMMSEDTGGRSGSIVGMGGGGGPREIEQSGFNAYS